MWPLLLRPECFFLTSISDVSGRFFVRSEKSMTVANRFPGDVGLNRLTGISDPH